VAAAAAQPLVAGAAPPAVAGNAKISPVVWIGAGGAVAFLAVVLAMVAILAGPKPPVTCHVPCPVPPHTYPPLAAPLLYTSAKHGYTLEYYSSIVGDTPSVMNDDSIGWRFGSSGLWPSTFTGELAAGMSAQQVVDAVHSASYSGAALAFQIPDAGLGYNAGAGGVYEYTFSPTGGTSFPARLLIVASVRNGLAVYLVAIGPIDSDWARPHPNPSETVIGQLMSPLANGITFPGDTAK
jgi:hypothetical protein